MQWKVLFNVTLSFVLVKEARDCQICLWHGVMGVGLDVCLAACAIGSHSHEGLCIHQIGIRPKSLEVGGFLKHFLIVIKHMFDAVLR